MARFAFCRSQSIRFGYQGSADLNSYKLFLEVVLALLKRGPFRHNCPDGPLLRLWYLHCGMHCSRHGRHRCSLCFQNEKKVFEEAHHAASNCHDRCHKGGTTKRLRPAFAWGWRLTGAGTFQMTSWDQMPLA